MVWPWPPVHLGQLAPTSLPQCRLVSNPCSAGLSLSGPSLCASLHPTLSLSLSVTRPLSLSRIKGVSGCSVGLYPPRGSNPPLRNRRGVLYPLYYEEMLSSLCCSAAQSCSALSLCLPLSLSLSLSLSLCVSRSLSLSLLAPLLLPLLTLPWGFSCASAASYTPPACCPLSGISPFAWRCAQQHVEEPYSVSGYRVCLLEERSLEQP